jgi:hypothetical protein
MCLVERALSRDVFTRDVESDVGDESDASVAGACA